MAAPFICGRCGADTVLASADGSPAVCVDCCEDHEYIYEPGDGHMCMHCGARPPDDWFMVD